MVENDSTSSSLDPSDPHGRDPHEVSWREAPGEDRSDVPAERARASRSLIRTLYDELHRLAEARLRGMRPGQTMQATDLVHEAYARLESKPDRLWQTRAEFFAAAACAMRDFHVEYIRRRATARRGGDLIRTDAPLTFCGESVDVAELCSAHAALERLRDTCPARAEIFLLKEYTGLTTAEIARMVGVSERTVERRLRFARAFMRDLLREPRAGLDCS